MKSLRDKSTSGGNMIPKLLREDGLQRVTHILMGTEPDNVTEAAEL